MSPQTDQTWAAELRLLGDSIRNRLEVYGSRVADYHITTESGTVVAVPRNDSLPTISGTGTAAVLTAVLSKIGTAGGTIAFGTGSFSWEAPVTLPTNCTHTLRIIGQEGTVFVLTRAGRRMFDLGNNGVADDLYTNYEIGHFDIDASALGGGGWVSSQGHGHILIGSYIDGAFQAHYNVSNIYIHDIVMTGIPSDLAQGSAHDYHYGIQFQPKHTVISETPQSYVQDILIERVRIIGGNEGITIGGICSNAGTGGTNIICDRVCIRDCYHDVNLNYTTVSNSGANFFVGKDARVGKVLIENCVGLNCPDSGVEVDNASYCVIRNCTIFDTLNCAYVIVNFNTPLYGADSQNILHEGCQAVRQNQDMSGTPGHGGFYVSYSGGNVIGNVTYRNCSYSDILGGTNTLGTSSPSGGFKTGGAPTLNNLVFDNFAVDLQNVTNSGVSGMIGINIAGMTGNCTIRNYSFKATGSNSGTCILTPLDCASNGSGNFNLYVDGMTVNEAVTGITVSGLRCIDLMRSGALQTCYFDIRRFRLINATNLTPQIFKFGGTGTVTVVPGSQVVDFDLSAAPATTSEFNYTAPSIQGSFKIDGRWRVNPQANVAIVPSGSPFTYQHLNGMEGSVVVQGGTVSKVEKGNDGSTWVDTGVTAGTFWMSNQQYLRVTYTVAPTMTFIPNRK